MTSKVTKNYRLVYWILFAVSLLLNVCPLSVYVIKALAGPGVTHQKVTLTMTVLVVLILSIISWANKLVLRSKIWVIVIALYFILDKFATPIIILACCQVVDELIVCPIKNHYKTKLTINKEMDKR